MPFLITLFFMISSLFAGVEKMTLKNLDLEYDSNYGQGTFDKFSIGIGMSPFLGAQEIFIFKRENSFDLSLGNVELEWIRPIQFVLDLKRLKTQNLNLEIQKTFHALNFNQLSFSSAKDAEYKFEEFSLRCEGDSVDENLLFKLQKDCLHRMELSIKEMEIPFELLKTIASQLPEVPAETDFPANDFYLSVGEGNIYSSLRVKLLIPTYLKFWGMTQIEDQGQTLAIRVGEIRYGNIPVTDLVMKILSSQVRHDRVKIDPPWIRIKIGLKNEAHP